MLVRVSLISLLVDQSTSVETVRLPGYSFLICEMCLAIWNYILNKILRVAVDKRGQIKPLTYFPAAWLVADKPVTCHFFTTVFRVCRWLAVKSTVVFVDTSTLKQKCPKRKLVPGKRLKVVRSERSRFEPTGIMSKLPNTPATLIWYEATVAHINNTLPVFTFL